jgi:hypothetical protein
MKQPARTSWGREFDSLSTFKSHGQLESAPSQPFPAYRHPCLMVLRQRKRGTEATSRYSDEGLFRMKHTIERTLRVPPTALPSPVRNEKPPCRLPTFLCDSSSARLAWSPFSDAKSTRGVTLSSIRSIGTRCKVALAVAAGNAGSYWGCGYQSHGSCKCRHHASDKWLAVSIYKVFSRRVHVRKSVAGCRLGK